MSEHIFGPGMELLHNDFGSVTCPWCGRVVKKVLATQKYAAPQSGSKGIKMISEISTSQQAALRALIAGASLKSHAFSIGKNEKAVAQDLHRCRELTGLTTYQLVAHIAADLARQAVERS